VSKSFYIFISLLLGVNFWELVLISTVFNSNTTPIFILIWGVVGLLVFKNQPLSFELLDYKKYAKYFYWWVIGFVLSIIPAYFFWNQDFLSSILVNRGLIVYLFIPVLLKIKPTDQDIVKALIFFTITYMVVWAVQSISPIPLTMPFYNNMESGAPFERNATEFGYLLPGYQVMLLLLYLCLQRFKENVTLKTLVPAVMMLSVFFILQNRGMLVFICLFLVYIAMTLKSRFKPYILLLLLVAAIGVFSLTTTYWLSLWNETSNQADDMDYDRWKAFYFFIFDYAPNWLCAIFGNGRLSVHNQAGDTIYSLHLQGYDQTDIGLFGLWSVYGIIPIIVLAMVLYKVLRHKQYPLFTKAMALHILCIPISFTFIGADALVFILLFYLFAYYSESYKLIDENVNLHQP